MRLPIMCPICNNVLVTDFIDGGTEKHCYTRLGHQLLLLANNADEVWFIRFVMKGFHIEFNSVSKTINITTIERGGITLPYYFDPDLTNPKELIQKIKTYIAFS